MEPMPKYRLTLCHILAGLFGLLVTLPVMLLITDSRECIQLVSGKIDPRPVVIGERVTVEWRVKEFMSCDGVIFRRIRDSGGTIHEFAATPTVYHNSNLTQKEQTFRQSFIMPVALPGDAFYEPVVKRWRNPLQKFWPTIETYSIPFEVDTPPALPIPHPQRQQRP